MKFERTALGRPTGASATQRLCVSLVVAVLLALSAVLPGAAAASAASPIAGASPAVAEKPDTSKLQTFGIGPANVKGLDRRSAFIYVARPGEVIKDRFALVNYTTKPVKVKVYASDAFTTKEGAYDVLAAAKKSRDVGVWAGVKARTVTIPARKSLKGPPGQLVVPFTLRVPVKASPGDHAGGVIASVTSLPVGGQANAVVVDNRVGTRLYVRVRGPLDPRLEIQDLTASYQGTLNPIGRGTVRLSYRVKNTGNVALSAVQRVKVTGFLGTSAQAEPLADLSQVLPGGDVVVTAEIKNVIPTIRVKAVVELDPYSGPVDAKQFIPTVSASSGLWAIPWTLIALLIAMIAISYYLNRRRRAAPTHEAIETSEIDDVVMVP